MADIGGSELYKKVVIRAEVDDRRGRLMKTVWSPTPWMVDVFTGSTSNSGRYAEIMDWCREKFGQESSPIHGVDGTWHCGLATIHGFTWMGFATKDQMEAFCERWAVLSLGESESCPGT